MAHAVVPKLPELWAVWRLSQTAWIVPLDDLMLQELQDAPSLPGAETEAFSLHPRNAICPSVSSEL